MREKWGSFSRPIQGFTLVELLVVIAIVGVLVALLLPAVQAAREAARRAQCSNNLKQLGVALQMHHGNHDRFPLGSGCVTCAFPTVGAGPDTERANAIISLLPFMEQQSLYDACDLTRNSVHNSFLASGMPVHAVWIDILLCPSAQGREYIPDGNPFWKDTDGLNMALSNYGLSMGSQRFGSCFRGNEFDTGRSPHGHSTDADRISGVFSHFAWGASIRQISDGTSNTIAMGEILPTCSWHASDGWMHTNSLWFATSCPINHPTCKGESGYDRSCAPPVQWSCDMGFKSRHPGGAQFVFCDGSVHLLSENIDFRNYQRLGDRRDGETLEGL